MDISINTSGTALEVGQTVATRIEQERAAHPEASTALAALADYVHAQVATAPPGARFTVTSDIKISVQQQAQPAQTTQAATVQAGTIPAGTIPAGTQPAPGTPALVTQLAGRPNPTTTPAPGSVNPTPGVPL